MKSQFYMTSQNRFNLGAKKTVNTKHRNMFLTSLAGQLSQGQTGTRPKDKQDKMATLLWNSTENGRFVPGTGPSLSQERVPVCPRKGSRLSQGRFLFVPDTVQPKMFMFIGFSCAINHCPIHTAGQEFYRHQSHSHEQFRTMWGNHTWVRKSWPPRE